MDLGIVSRGSDILQNPPKENPQEELETRGVMFKRSKPGMRRRPTLNSKVVELPRLFRFPRLELGFCGLKLRLSLRF